MAKGDDLLACACGGMIELFAPHVDRVSNPTAFTIRGRCIKCGKVPVSAESNLTVLDGTKWFADPRI